MMNITVNMPELARRRVCSPWPCEAGILESINKFKTSIIVQDIEWKQGKDMSNN